MHCCHGCDWNQQSCRRHYRQNLSWKEEVLTESSEKKEELLVLLLLLLREALLWAGLMKIVSLLWLVIVKLSKFNLNIKEFRLKAQRHQKSTDIHLAFLLYLDDHYLIYFQGIPWTASTFIHPGEGH